MEQQETTLVETWNFTQRSLEAEKLIANVIQASGMFCDITRPIIVAIRVCCWRWSSSDWLTKFRRYANPTQIETVSRRRWMDKTFCIITQIAFVRLAKEDWKMFLMRNQTNEARGFETIIWIIKDFDDQQTNKQQLTTRLVQTDFKVNFAFTLRDRQTESHH